MSDIAIKIDGISKVYKLYNKPSDRVKEALNPFRKKYHHDFYALRGVSFEVKRGETIGIIGKNGSGKSTLLKVLTGVLTPSSGTARVHGKVSSLLELGVGFNPELTGLENVYFNGAVLGFSKEEIDRKLNEILEFADIGEFIGQPVKTYSSGMQVRLAFAVAVSVDPDVLIVDEALAVGDMSFQKKCMEKIVSFREAGKTIIFCSHDIHAVSALCDRAIWLKDGSVADIGKSDVVISSYVSWMMNAEAVVNKSVDNVSKNPNYFVRNSEEVEITAVDLYDIDGKVKEVFLTGEDLVFEVSYNAFKGIKDPNYSVIIFREDKVPVGICKTNYHQDLKSRGEIVGKAVFSVILKNVQLNRGRYIFGVSVWDKAKKICFANNITREFEIKSLNVVFGPTEEKCVYFLEVNWKY